MCNKFCPWDKFNELSFLADVDIFFSQLKNRIIGMESSCNIEMAAKAHSKRVKHTDSDIDFKKARRFSKTTLFLQ